MEPQRFPVVGQKWANLVGIAAALCWAGLLIAYGPMAHYAPDQFRRLGLNEDAVEGFVVAIGTTVVWIGCLLAQKTAVVLSETGIAFERRGRPKWSMPWTDLAGWRWEKGRRDQVLGITLLSTAGEHRSIRMVRHGVGDATYTAFLQALHNRLPDLREMPARALSAVEAERQDWPLYLIALVVLIGFAAVVICAARGF